MSSGCGGSRSDRSDRTTPLLMCNEPALPARCVLGRSIAYSIPFMNIATSVAREYSS
ncbi:hypothetical protein [Lysobacter gummosus]|uniref:hypothetical protein n=1 Tax=Lysobacter gummosus TaxID=262324 RepID=UPI00363EB7FE